MAVEQPKYQVLKDMKILLSAVVAVLLLGIGAVIFFMNSEQSTAQESVSSSLLTVAESSSPVSYVNIAQPFVFNVTGDSRNRVVQIKVQLMIRGSENDGLARYHSPLIESTLLATFASATAGQLREPTGRIELRDKATNDIKTAMTKVVGQPVIERVLFTDFVMQ